MFNIKEEISAYESELIALRRDFHENPELGYREYRTSKIIYDYLKKLNIDVINISITGVVGILHGEAGEGKTILIRAGMDASPVDLSVTMRPLVYSYLLVYEFECGIEYVRLARGAMAGMAQSVYLQDGRTGSEKATVLFEDASVDSERGVVTAVIRTFGVPDFPDRYYNGTTPESESGTFGLNLEVMLPDGSIKVFEFDISDQMLDQPRGGVITVSGLTIYDWEFGGGGSFDVEVDDWGPYEDVDLPL